MRKWRAQDRRSDGDLVFSSELKVGLDTRSTPGAPKLAAFTQSVSTGFTDMVQLDVFSGALADNPTGQIADAPEVLMNSL